MEELKSSQRQRNINLPTAKSTCAPRTSYHDIQMDKIQNLQTSRQKYKTNNKYQIQNNEKMYRYISQTQNEVLINNPGSTEDSDTVLPILKELSF